MNKKLQAIRNENVIIYIYFILLFIYLYANRVEINYLQYQNEEDKQLYQLLLYIVFGTAFIISLYYAIEGIDELNEPVSPEILKLEKLSALANVLIVIATGIYLYIIYKDEDINLEVSP